LCSDVIAVDSVELSSVLLKPKQVMWLRTPTLRTATAIMMIPPLRLIKGPKQGT